SRAGRASSHPVAFDPARSLGSHHVSYFGTPSRGLHARCLRFVITVARVQPYDHARLASGVAVSVVAGGIFTPGCSLKFWVCYILLLFSQACPGARAVASTAGGCEAREVEYCQRWRCETGGAPTPARRTPDIAVSERARVLAEAGAKGSGE